MADKCISTKHIEILGVIDFSYGLQYFFCIISFFAVMLY